MCLNLVRLIVLRHVQDPQQDFVGQLARARLQPLLQVLHSLLARLGLRALWKLHDHGVIAEDACHHLLCVVDDGFGSLELPRALLLTLKAHMQLP